MSNNISNPSPADHRVGRNASNRRERRRGLPDLVAQWFYKHGLFLSSYPTCASSIAIIAIIFSCYPLLNIPLPGTIPTRVILPSSAAESMGYESSFGDQSKNFSLVKNLLTMNNSTSDAPFPWAQSSPYLYVQQIIMKSSVHPWMDELRMMDAFRGPLYQVYKLLEVVRNHEDNSSKTSLDHICLHVENVKRTVKDNIFPEYNCLVLSPANLWRQDVQKFSKDPNILNTVFQYHNLQKTKISVAEMLFGLPMHETGLKRYPIKSRSRVIQYALTLILTKSDQKYLDSLKAKLQSEFPLYQFEDSTTATSDKTRSSSSSSNSNSKSSSSVMFIYYPGEFRLMEFVPIITAFIILFIYINFSLRKIEMVKSRIILATFAVITILGSLMMSLGLCFFFGLTITLQSKGVFPYLVILVGLENCLVITKSVVTTDETFDIKIRVAQGLSKEGWHISKTLLTEITILTIGLATFVPVIQEFCIFAIVGLISDFFLQMLLFSTVLALDIKRIEYTTEAKYMPKIMSFAFNDKRNQRNFYDAKRNQSSGFSRSHSQPKLATLDGKIMHSPDGMNHHPMGHNGERRIPKRLKVVNFWARTRFFQRAFMLWMSVWILSIIYSSGFLQNLLLVVNSTDIDPSASAKTINKKSIRENFYTLDIPNTQSTDRQPIDDKLAEQLKRLQHPNFEINYSLSNFHWSTILKQYNISLSGRYVTILPSIKLSHAVEPEVAIHLRHPNEKDMQNFQWKALAAALDPLDFNDDDELNESHITPPGGAPLFPKSPMEIFLATLLCAISVFVLTYALVVFYRCICTRNYAEWRSSWNEIDPNLKNTERVLEGVPIQVQGHNHKIECLVSDGMIVVSSCLKGQIKVWDSKTGELITEIDRSGMLMDMEIASHEDMNHIDEALIQQKVSDNRTQTNSASPVWCLDYLDNLIAVGCANGRLEFWESPTGFLKCTYEGDLKKLNGVTHISLNSDRVIVARLCGRLDFYKLETYYKGVQIDWGFTSAYRRTHVRTSSTGSLGIIPTRNYSRSNTKEEMRCLHENSRMAHQQPITCMEVLNGIIFTGSQDHTLKVYRLEDLSADYTLHGHCGPITCLFVDPWQFGTGGSGSQDGLLCIWDLFTGACLYSIQAHYGAITSLACAPSYIISVANDEKVCVWERFQGNLLCTINITNAYTNLQMLTPSLLVTSKMGSLMVWDVRTGEPTREVKLDCSISQLCPKNMILVSNSIICDYGNELRIVKFPMVADKCN